MDNPQEVSNQLTDLKNKTLKSDKIFVFSSEKTSAETDSVCLQRLINSCFTNTGGWIIIDRNINIDTQIELKSYCRITGISRKTTIKIANQSKIDSIFKINGVNYSSIEQLTLDGNKGKASGSGILFTDTIRHYLDNCYFRDLYVTQFSDYGIYVNKWYCTVVMENIDCCYCDNSGLVLYGSDCIITNIYTHSCGNSDTGYFGMLIDGGNNKFSNVKVWNCGKTANKTGGIYIRGKASQLFGIEAQENGYYGIFIKNCNDCQMSLVADCNNVETATISYGIYISYSWRNQMQISCTNLLTSHHQIYGLYLHSDVNDNIIGFTSDGSHTKEVQNLGSNNIFNGNAKKNQLLIEESSSINTLLSNPTLTNGASNWTKIGGTYTNKGVNCVCIYTTQYNGLYQNVAITSGHTYLFALPDATALHSVMITIKKGSTTKTVSYNMNSFTWTADETFTAQLTIWNSYAGENTISISQVVFIDITEIANNNQELSSSDLVECINHFSGGNAIVGVYSVINTMLS